MTTITIKSTRPINASKLSRLTKRPSPCFIAIINMLMQIEAKSGLAKSLIIEILIFKLFCILKWFKIKIVKKAKTPPITAP